MRARRALAALFTCVALASPAATGAASAAETSPQTQLPAQTVVSLERTAVDIPVPSLDPVSVSIVEDGRHRTAVVRPREGVATVWVRAFSQATAQVRTPSGSVVDVPIVVEPPFEPVTFPRKAPQPKVTVVDPPAVGAGANAAVTRVSKERRQAMKGLSWSSRCLPISQLRQVHVNYIDPEGFRRRGELIVRHDVAKKVAQAFTELYDIGYRFRSIHPVDVYGKSPKGIGANDYASMRAGNTSAFNCRYIVGKESSKEMSPHAYGRAVDINTWDNPYVARSGVFPNSYYLSDQRRKANPLGLTAGSAPVTIMRKLGWEWGGSYRDYHHFQ